MANKKIENKDLIADNLLEPTIKEFEELLKVVKLTEEAFKDLLQQSIKQAKAKPFDGYSNLKDIANGIEGVDNAVEGLTKAEKERLKLLEQVNKATKKNQKSFEELEKQLIEEKKALADLAKEQKKEGANIDDIVKKRVQLKAQILATSTAIRNEQKEIRKGLELQRKSNELKSIEALERATIQEEIKAQTKALREEAKERAGLISEYTKQSKKLNELRKEYKQLALTEGESSKQARGLLKEIKKLDRSLKDLDSQVGQNYREVGSYKEQLRDLEDAMQKLGKAGKITKNALKLGGILAILGAIKSSFAGSEKGAVAFQKVMTSVSVTISLFITKMVELFEVTESGWDLYKNGKKVFKGFGDEVKDLIEKNLALVESNEELRKSFQASELEIANLRKRYEALKLSAEDATTPLQNQIDKALEASKLYSVISSKEIELARKRAENAKTALDNDKTNLIKQEEYTQAYVAYIDKQIEANQELNDVDKTFREALRDELEQELDFILDVSDRKKTIAEKDLANDKLATDERIKAIKQAEKDTNDSFDSVINKAIEYQRKLNESGKTNVDLIKLEAQLRTLSGLETTEAINNQAKAIEFDELVKKRVLELVIALTDAEQDFKESKEDVTEILQTESDLNNDILLQNQRIINLQETGVDLTEEERIANEKLLDSNIQLLQSRILLESDSVNRLKLQKELNALIIQRTIEQVKKVKAIEKKASDEKAKKDQAEIDAEKKKQDRIAELKQLGVDSVKQFAQKSLDNTTANIDRELQALEQRESTLRALAEKGVENVENNLAIEQKKRAELEAKRAQAVRRQQNIELGLSVLETYSNKVASDDPNPLGSTIADTSLLLSFISSLPAFLHGTEDTGTVANPLDANGGRVAVLHDNERVLTAQQNAMIPKGVSNLELATMAQMSSKAVIPTQISDNSEMVRKLDELKTAIENKPVHDFKYDDVKKAVADVVETKGRRETNWRRNSDFF